MKIDLSCPVEVRNHACPTPERNTCVVQLYNLTPKNIVSAELNVCLLDRENKPLQRTIHRCYSLHGYPLSLFEASVGMEYCADAVRAEVTAEKVWFDDNGVWRKDRDPFTEYEPNTLGPCLDLDMLHYIAGPAAVGYPVEQDRVWLCVCGRPNTLTSPYCVRCRQSKEQIFASFNRQRVHQQYALKQRQLALRSRALREDNTRLQRIREHEYELEQARSSGDRRILTALGVTCALAALLFFLGVPGLRFLSARYEMDHGNAARAEQTLTQLGSFPGAAESLDRCRRLRAEQTLGGGDAAALEQASLLLRQGGDEEGAELARRADYERATLLMEQGDYRTAASLFTSLGDWNDSATQLNETLWREACVNYEGKNYQAAEAAFTALGDYKDSAERARLSIYTPACVMEAGGDYRAAIEQFSRVPEYQDSASHVRDCWLKMAAQLEPADPLAAAEAYANSGDADAIRKAMEIRVDQAMNAELAGDLETAARLYQLAAPMEGATDRAIECILTLTRQALNDQEFNRANELLASLPEDCAAAADLRLDAKYRPGIAALKKKDWQTAVDLLTAAGAWKDAPANLEKARYGLAGALRKAGDNAGAAAQYTLLGDYKDSEKQLRTVRYDLGKEKLEAGYFSEASALFALLSDYKDSPSLLKESEYHYAQSLLASGDPAAAREKLSALGDYGQTAELLKACDHTEATQLLAAGETEKAAELFLRAGNYQDAADQATALYRELATEAENDGRILAAAAFYGKIAGDTDAAAKADALYDAYYGDVAVSVREANKAGDYDRVLTLLESVVTTDLPAKYADLGKIGPEAAYRKGNALLKDGKPYEALPWLRKAEGLHDTASLLKKGCYLILGSWADSQGAPYAVFREDGTCALDGQEHCFNVTGYDVWLGSEADQLTKQMRIRSVSARNLILTPIGGKDVSLSRLDTSDVLPENTLPETEDNGNDFAVEDE